MIEPLTAVPPRKPLTAAERSGYRSPPSATIIGKIGPDATPDSANRPIEIGSDGTRTAPISAAPRASAQASVNLRWSKRSAYLADTSRPTAIPAQYSVSASVAVARGAGSRNRTSQLDTPTSDAT